MRTAGPRPHFFARGGGVYDVRWNGEVIGTVERHGRVWRAAVRRTGQPAWPFGTRRAAAAWVIHKHGGGA